MQIDISSQEDKVWHVQESSVCIISGSKLLSSSSEERKMISLHRRVQHDMYRSRNLVSALSLAQSFSPPLHRRGKNISSHEGKARHVQESRVCIISGSKLLSSSSEERKIISLHRKAKHDMYRNLVCALSLALSSSS